MVLTLVCVDETKAVFYDDKGAVVRVLESGIVPQRPNSYAHYKESKAMRDAKAAKRNGFIRDVAFCSCSTEPVRIEGPMHREVIKALKELHARVRARMEMDVGVVNAAFTIT